MRNGLRHAVCAAAVGQLGVNQRHRASRPARKNLLRYRTPLGPRSRNRLSRRMRLRCANSISTFLRSPRDCANASVLARARTTSRAASFTSRTSRRHVRAALRLEWARATLRYGGQIAACVVGADVAGRNLGLLRLTNNTEHANRCSKTLEGLLPKIFVLECRPG